MTDILSKPGTEGKRQFPSESHSPPGSRAKILKR